jgi:hypothetical protein
MWPAATECSVVQAPKPSPGPHKTRDCLPIVVILRNRLKCGLLSSDTESCLSHASTSLATNSFPVHVYKLPMIRTFVFFHSFPLVCCGDQPAFNGIVSVLVTIPLFADMR